MLCFSDIFSQEIEYTASANGRINTLGEHTDYNFGLVLPTLLSLSTTVQAAVNTGAHENTIRVYSNNVSETPSSMGMSANIITVDLDDDPTHTWTDYVVGSLRVARNYAHAPLPALNIVIDSSVPLGCGVSSSAALEIALLRLANTIYQTSWNGIEIAKMGQQAENDYVGMPCGLMDQMVVSMGKQDKILYIDFGNAEEPTYREYPSFDDADFVVIPSQVPHRLVDGGYKTRKEQCYRAAALLQVPHLSAIASSELDVMLSTLDDTLLRSRVRHVVRENDRVMQGAKCLYEQNSARFGDLMYASHVSQRDDYDVSLPEIDALVDVALESGAMGARICGGGFGGSIVSLIKKGNADQFIETLNTKSKIRYSLYI